MTVTVEFPVPYIIALTFWRPSFWGKRYYNQGRVSIDGCRMKTTIDKYTKVYIFWNSIYFSIWLHKNECCVITKKK